MEQVFLLRGLAREARHWGNFIADLKSSYDERGVQVRIETIDLPGCGRHSEMVAPLTIEATADFVREKMKEILVREAEAGEKPADRRVLVAISLGGMVAASWLSRYPTDFHAAVLINSSYRGVSKIHERLMWQSWWRIPGILNSDDVPTRERHILEWISNNEARRKEVFSDWVSIQHSRPVSKLNLGIQLAAAACFTAPPKIAVPLLILASEQDRMVSPQCSKDIASRYDAPLLLHRTAGHDLPLDDGPWVANKIAEWDQLQTQQRQ